MLEKLLVISFLLVSASGCIFKKSQTDVTTQSWESLENKWIGPDISSYLWAVPRQQQTFCFYHKSHSDNFGPAYWIKKSDQLTMPFAIKIEDFIQNAMSDSLLKYFLAALAWKYAADTAVASTVAVGAAVVTEVSGGTASPVTVPVMAASGISAIQSAIAYSASYYAHRYFSDYEKKVNAETAQNIHETLSDPNKASRISPEMMRAFVKTVKATKGEQGIACPAAELLELP